MGLKIRGSKDTIIKQENRAFGEEIFATQLAYNSLTQLNLNKGSHLATTVRSANSVIFTKTICCSTSSSKFMSA
jgi:hypothetical protein